MDALDTVITMKGLYCRRGDLSRQIMELEKDLRAEAELHAIALSALSLTAVMCAIMAFSVTVAAGPILFIMTLTVIATAAAEFSYRRTCKRINTELDVLHVEADKLDFELNRGDMYDSSRPSLFARNT